MDAERVRQYAYALVVSGIWSLSNETEFSLLGAKMNTGVISKRRGFPVYQTNPSVPRDGLASRTKRIRTGQEAKGFLINGSGEVFGEGVAVAYEIEEVDDERFVKLYLDGIRQTVGLSKRGLAVFELVYRTLQDAPKTDKVELSVLTCGLSRSTFYIGLRDLLKRGFLFHSAVDGVFFVNIQYMFNGDRLAFVKAYHRRKVKKKGAPTNQLTFEMEPAEDRDGDPSDVAA
jgi:hypothetical protein